MGLEGKVALVTGAAGGIGSAIAKRLASDGATVVVADVDAEGAERVAAEMDGARARVADLADEDACRDLVDETLRREGRLDVLVNNAGLQHVSPIEDFPVERWATIVATMLTAPFVLIRQAIPNMYERGWGRVINIGSVHGLVASPNKSAYVAAKHGLLGLTRTVALEAGARGVTVNMVCPAYVRTPLVDRQIADQARTLGMPEDQVVERVMLEPSAIKRLVEPDEVAAYVSFLCSDDAAMITGAVQVIDGGWTAR